MDSLLLSTWETGSFREITRRVLRKYEFLILICWIEFELLKTKIETLGHGQKRSLNKFPDMDFNN